MIEQLITNWLTQFAYLALFLAIIASTIAIPIPEDIVLLVAGYLAANHLLNLWAVILVSLLAVILGDNTGYWLGRKGGGFLLERFINTNIQTWVKKHYRKHGPKTVFFSRFMTGIRNLFHLTAGASGMKWKTFFIYDLLGAIIAVPLVIGIGFVFGKYLGHITWIITTLDSILLYGLLIFILLLALFACVFREQAKTFVLTKILHKKIKNKLEQQWYYRVK